jgi:hypothetical protein
MSMGVCYVDSGRLTVVGGKTYRMAISAPPKGSIIRAQCIQTSGSKTTFSFSFYNSAASCPPDPLDPNGNPAPVTPAVVVDPTVEYMGQIGPTRSVATAQDRYLNPDGSDGGWLQIGMPYVNADGGISNAQSKIYIKFVAGGAGTYDVFLTIQTDK